MEKVKAGERESRSVMGTYNMMYVPYSHYSTPKREIKIRALEYCDPETIH